jgi:hypothetical protein
VEYALVPYRQDADSRHLSRRRRIPGGFPLRVGGQGVGG